MVCAMFPIQRESTKKKSAASDAHKGDIIAAIGLQKPICLCYLTKHHVTSQHSRWIFCCRFFLFFVSRTRQFYAHMRCMGNGRLLILLLNAPYRELIVRSKSKIERSAFSFPQLRLAPKNTKKCLVPTRLCFSLHILFLHEKRHEKRDETKAQWICIIIMLVCTIHPEPYVCNSDFSAVYLLHFFFLHSGKQRKMQKSTRVCDTTEERKNRKVFF